MLGGGRSRLSFCSDLREKIPLPCGLKKLQIKNYAFFIPSTWKKLDMYEEVIAPIKNYLKDCEITYEYGEYAESDSDSDGDYDDADGYGGYNDDYDYHDH